ncbi:MAG TPA: RidA family protein [Pseudomonas sp.]|uniref:RidA family protein n=1 Tax=Pseudomonas sp. TaxID=306 RepID=UPI002C44CFBE|nr:RidA family protein [Pseudomonas sp.]HSX90314.1 RidA family protein [Pseudomonas sp.]
MSVETYTPPELFEPIGPYSHIAKSGPFIYLSATPGVDGAGRMAGADAYAQSRQILENLRAMLASVGAAMTDVLHVQVFLKHVEDFEAMNRAYAEAFAGHLPARTVICVADLPKRGALLTMNLHAICHATGANSPVR